MEGITRITTDDFKYADKMGYSVKLVGTTRKTDGKLYSYVAPVMLPHDNPLAKIDDVYNGILVHGNALETVVLLAVLFGHLTT